MIIDTNNVPSLKVGIKAMADIRNEISRYQNGDVTTYYDVKNIHVLHYYTNPKELLNRICKLANVNVGDITKSNSKDPMKTVAWNIIKTFGYSDHTMAKLFNMSIGTRGVNSYYANKMRDMMIKSPVFVEIYSNIISILEKDKSKLYEELYNEQTG